MRTVLFFLFVVFTSTCFMWSAIFTGKGMVSHTLIALGLYGLFFYYWLRQLRKKRIREYNEAQFNAYVRDRMNNRR